MRPPARSRPNRLSHHKLLVPGTSYPAIARHVKVLIGTEALCGRATSRMRRCDRSTCCVARVKPIRSRSRAATRSRAAVVRAVVDVLRKELRDFKLRIDPQTAHDSYAAWRAGAHDDLVLAAAEAAWDADPLTRAPVARVTEY